MTALGKGDCCASPVATPPSRTRIASPGAQRDPQGYSRTARWLELARDRNQISADDILRAASASEEAGAPAADGSTLINDIIRPAMAETERTFSAALGRILIGDMIARAEALNSG